MKQELICVKLCVSDINMHLARLHAVTDKAGVKTLENGLMVFTTKELYSKRLSLCVYKNKTNKNTADKCIKIYYVS